MRAGFTSDEAGRGMIWRIVVCFLHVSVQLSESSKTEFVFEIRGYEGGSLSCFSKACCCSRLSCCVISRSVATWQRFHRAVVSCDCHFHAS